MASTTVFDRQPADYRERVLPSNLPAVAVEAGVPEGWWKYVGRGGEIIGMSRFGESAPAPELFRHFGLCSDQVVAAVRRLMRGAVPLAD
jgi:transketolase